jgi:hydrogenase expression/formation protein HypE
LTYKDIILPVGKLPPELLARVLSKAPSLDPRLVLGPGIGIDCAVIDVGTSLLVLKSDPITFATDQIGWYAVQINVNDIATTGAVPRWFLLTLLLPKSESTGGLVDAITDQVYEACRSLGISVVGGHTEITSRLDRPILIGTLIGEVSHEHLITPRGARAGNRILLTKGIPIEAISIIAREYSSQLESKFSPVEIEEARQYLFHPGISVCQDAQIAVDAGKVTAMHDPTEGGLSSALWELAEASQCTLIVNPEFVPVPNLARQICQSLNIDPLAAMASGALLLTVEPENVGPICLRLKSANIACTEIGFVEAGPPTVFQVGTKGRQHWPKPTRDEIARLYQQQS